MKLFSTKNKFSKLISFAVSAVFWTALWWIVSVSIGDELLLPSPVSTAKRLFVLSQTKFFWITAAASLFRVALGFFFGLAAGTFLGIVTAASRTADSFLSPIGNIIKSTPVASFIILALVWLKASNVPSFVSFLMVTPIIWNTLKTSIINTDKMLLEAAHCYRLGVFRTVKTIYIPSVSQQYIASLITSLGLAWKAGIAAEVLCHPKLSIGTMLYDAKIYLETPDLFAWTATVIFLSVLMEKLFGAMLKKTRKTQ